MSVPSSSSSSSPASSVAFEVEDCESPGLGTRSRQDQHNSQYRPRKIVHWDETAGRKVRENRMFVWGDVGNVPVMRNFLTKYAFMPSSEKMAVMSSFVWKRAYSTLKVWTKTLASATDSGLTAVPPSTVFRFTIVSILSYVELMNSIHWTTFSEWTR